MILTNKEAIQILSTRDRYGVPCGYTSGYQEALDMAIEALSADVVEVIRCKDCKWHFNGHLCKQLSQYGSIETPPSFYCGFGEKKGGDDK